MLRSCSDRATKETGLGSGLFKRSLRDLPVWCRKRPLSIDRTMSANWSSWTKVAVAVEHDQLEFDEYELEQQTSSFLMTWTAELRDDGGAWTDEDKVATPTANYRWFGRTFLVLSTSHPMTSTEVRLRHHLVDHHSKFWFK
jgi:hypothetical protein